MSIHDSAIICEGARLGENVTVGPYAIIESDTVIGDRTEIRAHAVVKRFTTLGCDNVIHESAIIGGEPQDIGFSSCESYVRIGARNQIREGATIHRGTQPGSETIIGSDCFIMACAHVAHNCRLEDRVILANNVALAGYVDVGERAFLSGGVVVHQFCRIGRLAMVGGNSKVVQDCLPFVVTDGVPSRARGLNLVGLRRAGFDSVGIAALKDAYRILLRSGLLLEEALERMTNLGNPAVNEMVYFVRGSHRSFCHE